MLMERLTLGIQAIFSFSALATLKNGYIAAGVSELSTMSMRCEQSEMETPDKEISNLCRIWKLYSVRP